MKLQVLVSTMNQSDNRLLEDMNLQSDTIIINQCDRSGETKFQYKKNNIKWINATERGLSKSRNLAITQADGDICLLADDDLVYVNNYQEAIMEQFQKYPEVDVIAFQVEGIEKSFKKYYPYIRKVGYLTSMKDASVEIAFRLESIKKAGLRFNELFGAGSKYFMGEESIFLYQCLKHNLKILYIPIKIADLHIVKSTWFNGYTKEYFISKGAAYYSMSKKMYILLIFQFAIRRFNLYKDETSLFEAIKSMLYGAKEYRTSLEGKNV